MPMIQKDGEEMRVQFREMKINDLEFKEMNKEKK